MIRQTSRAIVLRSWPWSESSLVVRVLTPESGVLGLLARGACRPTSGMMGVLDTWHHVELEYGGPERAELSRVYRAELLEHFPGLARGAESLAVAALAAEIAELAAPSGAPAGEACAWLLDLLRRLDRGAAAGPLLGRAMLGGLDLLGLGPVLEDRSRGGRVRHAFSNAAGGLVTEAADRTPGPVRALSRPALVWMRRLREAARSGGETPPPPGTRPAREALTILGDFLAFHLERPPRAWSFLRPRLGRLTATT